MKLRLSAVALCTGWLAAPLLAHDGDLKYLHRQPAHRGAGFQNKLLANPNAARTAGPNFEMGVGGFPSNGVTLLAWLSLDDFGVPQGGNGNSMTGYTSPGGRRYALMGLSNGTAFVDVTTPNAPVIVAQQPGPNSLWRDVRAYGQYAYAVSEGGGGVQVFNMAQIDSGIVSNAGTISDDGISSTHTVEINQDSGFLYRAGGQSNTGLRIYDLNQSPTNPPRVATWNDRYVHEVSIFSYTSGPYAGREIAFTCGGFNGGFQSTALTVLDVTNKANVVTMDTQAYPGAAYCHQGWLSADGQYFYINDELYVGPATTHVMNVSDLNNLTVAGSFTSNNTAAAHNVYIDDGMLYSASYRAGLRVWDLNQSALNPPEVRWFDTWPEDDLTEFNGLWNNYPFFGGGIVLGSDIEKGLFVWYVGDPQLTLSFLGGAPNQVSPSGETFTVQIAELQAGDYEDGTAQLHIDGGSGFVSIPLVDVGGGNFDATFPPDVCGDTVDYYVSAESTTGVVWTEPAGAPFVLHQAQAASALNVVMSDDFESNQGWSTSVQGASSGDWERGVPVDDSSWAYDPAADSDGSGQCYLTENQNGNSDVDGGSVTLTSPALDMSGGLANVSYDYYLTLTNADGTDMLLVEASSNGLAGPWLEIARHDTDGALSWRSAAISSDALALLGVVPGADVRVRFTANDGDPQSIIEAGVDAFRVEAIECGTGTPFCSGDGSGPACPCLNQGSTGRGCDNSAATGGVLLTATGDPAANNVVLLGDGFPPAGTPTVVAIRSTAQNASPPAFGDGVLCLQPAVARIQAGTASGGSVSLSLNHGAGAGGFHYQLWYRNTGAFCTADVFNTSNGYSIVWP